MELEGKGKGEGEFDEIGEVGEGEGLFSVEGAMLSLIISIIMCLSHVVFIYLFIYSFNVRGETIFR